MNNRYICRGKRKDNGEWVTGHYVFQRKCSGVFGQMISELDFDRHLIIDLRGNSHEVVPETVGQCTGKTVKTGKVFEGDIGKSVDGLFLVRWSDEKSNFVMNFYDYPYEELYLEEMWEDSEIVGNIYDNPKLLEVER